MQNGNTAASSFLGKMAYHGLGMTEDNEKAVQWLEIAVKKHNSIENSLLLGKLYYEGRGIDQDYHKAAIHLGYAAEQGDVEAQTMMAHLY